MRHTWWGILLTVTTAVGVGAGASVLLPNPQMTPGWTRPVSLMALCTAPQPPRHVTQAMKARVARAYGLPRARWREVEFDHLIPRELGGADDVRNLWPQPLAEARIKDQLENCLHRLVCAQQVPLATAQRLIATNWPQTWQQYAPRCSRP